MAKAGHIIVGLALPVIGLIASVVQYNDDKQKYSVATGPSQAELERADTYLLLRDEVDRILADKTIAKYGDSLAAAVALLDTNSHAPVKINEDLQRIFMDSLFAGNYKPLYGNLKRMVLTPDGHTMGFKDYSEYSLGDIQGNLSSYGALDVITFREYSGMEETYHWRYAGDTLVFTALVFNGGKPELGEASYKFLNFEVAYKFER